MILSADTNFYGGVSLSAFVRFYAGGGITHCNSANYILERWRSATAGCLSAYRPCNSPAGGVRATAISSGHRVRRCGHFGLTCRRNPTHNALCGTLTPQVIFTKPESLAVTCNWRIVCPLKGREGVHSEHLYARGPSSRALARRGSAGIHV